MIEGEIKQEVEQRLRPRHSPEQISGASRVIGLKVSAESIYWYVVGDSKKGGDLRLQLRINGKHRYKRRVKAGRAEKIPNRVDIEKRLESVDQRLYFGEWETDLIESIKGSGFRLSLYECKSRMGKLYKLSCKESYETASGIVMILRK